MVIDVAVRFYKTVHTSAGTSASLDMYEVFAETIDSFKRRRETVTKSIWKNQIAAGGSEELDGVFSQQSCFGDTDMSISQRSTSMSLPDGFLLRIAFLLL